MAARDFADWWEEFQRWLDGRPDPHEGARRLRRRLLRVERESRRRWTLRVLEDLLRRRHAYGVALFLLEGMTDPSYLRDIAADLQPLPGLQCDDEESHLADLIRILAAAGAEELLPPVEGYLLERPVGPHWASVPWALWPRHKQLFTRAWSRFFVEQPPDDWHNTLVIRSFLIEPEAVRLIRPSLERDAPSSWETLRESLIRQAGNVSWLSEEEHAELERAIT